MNEETGTDGALAPEENHYVPEMDAYPAKNHRIDMASSKFGVMLSVKTWGQQFANRPMVLMLTKETATDLLRRLQKAVDGLI